MTDRTSQLLGVGEVEHLVWGVGIRQGAADAESNDLRIWVDTLELVEERN